MKAENLRKSILQMAIQGKLVPQNPNDEPASVLLEKIRAEKQRLMKEGKIKKDKVDSVIFKGVDNRPYEKVGKNEPICIEDEIPFDIPDSWAFCRFCSIAEIFTGDSINETEKQRKYVGLESGYNYIGTKDIGFDHSINYRNGVKIPFEQINFKIAHKNTPLLCIEGGSAGRKIGILDENVCFGNKLCAFETNSVNPRYIYYYLQNPIFTQIFNEKTTGIIGGVSVNTLKHLLFAVPPLAEQERIVKKIEEFEPLIAEYEKLEQQKSKLDGEIYDKLKKSILQYAIQGKLVPQDENDEPASELLKRIRDEKKVKLGKKYIDSYIYKGDDNCPYEHIDGKPQDEVIEVPFDLPDNWAWVRLDNLITIISGVSYDKGDVCREGIRILRGGNINNLQISTSNEDIFLPESYRDVEKQVRVNDIIIVASTGSKSVIGKAGYVENNLDNTQIGAFLRIVRPVRDDIAPYTKLIFATEYYRERIRTQAGGTNINNVRADYISNLIVPIPPLAEQKRIVEKINEIFAKL